MGLSEFSSNRRRKKSDFPQHPSFKITAIGDNEIIKSKFV
jgi:hypothetical protein